MSHQLKPCAHCAGDAVLHVEDAARAFDGDGPMLWICCMGCGIRTMPLYAGVGMCLNEQQQQRMRELTEQSLVELWNRRAQQDVTHAAP